MVHDLKCWPEYYWSVVTGKKPFEIRKNDRDFSVGDCLNLQEFDPKAETYSGHSFMARVTYMTDFLQQPGVVVMAVEPAHGSWTTEVKVKAL